MHFHALILLLYLGAQAQADTAHPTEIKQLIQELGALDFRQREQAARRLESIGAPAVELLRAAGGSQDAEIRHRADLIIAHIENTDPAFAELREERRIRGIVTMLAYPDSKSYERAREELVDKLPDSLPILREASKSDNILLRSRVKTILRKLKPKKEKKSESD